MGRQWAIMRNMPDWKNLDPSEGVANIKFSAFLEINNMFFKISNVLFRYSWKKTISSLKSNYLTLNLTLPVDRRTVFKKTCRWFFRLIRYHQKSITYFLPLRPHTQGDTQGQRDFDKTNQKHIEKNVFLKFKNVFFSSIFKNIFLIFHDVSDLKM